MTVPVPPAAITAAIEALADTGVMANEIKRAVKAAAPAIRADEQERHLSIFHGAATTAAIDGDDLKLKAHSRGGAA